MKSIECPVHALRTDERISRKMQCIVVWKGHTARRVTIENFSRKGVLLRGSAGLYLQIQPGDEVVVYATFPDEGKVCLQGVACRSTRGKDQLIALRDVKWYQGWPSALSDDEHGAPRPDASVARYPGS